MKLPRNDFKLHRDGQVNRHAAAVLARARAEAEIHDQLDSLLGRRVRVILPHADTGRTGLVIEIRAHDTWAPIIVAIDNTYFEFHYQLEHLETI